MKDEIIQPRTQRWLDFYQKGTPRILYLINIQEDFPSRPWPHPDFVEARLEWAWQKYCTMLEHLDWLDDDSIPYLDVYTGTEIFGEAFGCKVHYSDDNMPFALPAASTWQEAQKILIPDLASSSLSYLFEMMSRLRNRAGKEALVKMVDLQSPMDISALIWDKNSFYTALIENPGAVIDLSSKVHEFLVQFLDTWFHEFGKTFLAHYPDYYVPYGITLSEDEIGAVNPEMFEKFFFPELESLSRRYGQIGIHCCAHARHQWPNLLKIPNLFLLNLVQSLKVTNDAYHYFSPFFTQMHSWTGEGEPWTWPSQIPSQARVVLTIDSPTRKQAVETASRMHEAIHLLEEKERHFDEAA
jgi:hypothetical protein